MGSAWHNAKAWCALAQCNARAHALAWEPWSPLVHALKLGSREVRREDLAVVLSRPGPAHGAPLAQPHTVPPPRARGHETGQPTAVSRRLEVKRRASQRAVGLWPQHRAHVRTRNAQITALEHDAQLHDAAGGARPTDLHVRDPLQPTTPPSHAH